jgi:hypothetical protein
MSSILSSRENANLDGPAGRTEGDRSGVGLDEPDEDGVIEGAMCGEWD